MQRREHEVAGFGGGDGEGGGSRSRISPTRMMSGSWRRACLRAEANEGMSWLRRCSMRQRFE